MTPLVAHPSTPAEGIAVTADVVREGEVLRFAYRLSGALERVVLPPEAAPERGDHLWEHTCFEAFVRPAGSSAYVELNVAPSGAWAVYGFSDYRVATTPPPSVPEVSIHRGARVLDAAVILRLPSDRRDRGLQIGLSAVVELTDAGCTYWALRHPAGRPDFHHPDAFIVSC